MSNRHLLLLIAAAVALLFAGSAVTYLLDDGGGTKTTTTVVLPKKLAGPQGRQFYLSPLPPTNTKAGAEIRVLNEATEVTPPAVQPMIRALRVNGGALRQNSYASCYLNASSTARVCTLTIRRGTKPWIQARYTVSVAFGQVTYKGYTIWQP